MKAQVGAGWVSGWPTSCRAYDTFSEVLGNTLRFSHLSTAPKLAAPVPGANTSSGQATAAFHDVQNCSGATSTTDAHFHQPAALDLVAVHSTNSRRVGTLVLPRNTRENLYDIIPRHPPLARLLAGRRRRTGHAAPAAAYQTAQRVYPSRLPGAAPRRFVEMASGAASGNEEIRYLVVDGYVKSGRDVLEAGGATTAGQLYANMLVKATERSVGRSAEAQQKWCSIIIIGRAESAHNSPPCLAQYHGVGWSGSSLAVHEREDPSVVQMMNLARQSFAHGVPQFGSCFGLQLAVATAGGVVKKNKHGKELGVARKIRLNAAGRAHPMYEGKPSVFGAFSSHKDEVRVIQPGGLLLATNAFTTVQSVCLRYLKGEFWGLQYHPEYDLHEMARLLYCRREMNTQLGFFADVEDSDRFVELLEKLAADPTREDLAWQIGYDKDVLDEDLRTCEVKNFVKHLVMPYYMQCREQGGNKETQDVSCRQEEEVA
ncbi:hypothetical protein ON010_g800 [Phytophthora cinnamomi]|nr:hypothetical protein ON010_g800 [Phytophthora cinnamomi]